MLALTPVPLGGIIHDFETPALWVRGVQPYGSLTPSTEQVRNGSYAGRLDYWFSNKGSNNDGQNNNDYVIFKSLPEISLAGQPTEISAWVYGDGSNHYLNVWIRDGAGEIWQFTFGQIRHTGWQQMTAYVDKTQPWPSDHIDGPGNGVVEYPIRFVGLALDDVPDTYTGTSKIYLDDIVSGPVANSIAPTPAFPFSIAEQGNRAFQTTNHHPIVIFVAVVNEKNIPLGGYKVIGDHTPSGRHVESTLTEPDWSQVNCLSCGYIKQGNVKLEPGNFEDGIWNIYLADINDRQLSPVVPLSYSADPSTWVWDFVLFKRN